MDYFGINSSEELPQISEVLADQMVTPTLVNADHFELEGEAQDNNFVDDETNRIASAEVTIQEVYITEEQNDLLEKESTLNQDETDLLEANNNLAEEDNDQVQDERDLAEDDNDQVQDERDLAEEDNDLAEGEEPASEQT